MIKNIDELKTKQDRKKKELLQLKHVRNRGAQMFLDRTGECPHCGVNVYDQYTFKECSYHSIYFCRSCRKNLM